jgi:hypothetical protein
MLFEWTSNDVQKKKKKGEGLKWNGKIEWSMVLKLWGKENGKT